LRRSLPEFLKHRFALPLTLLLICGGAVVLRVCDLGSRNLWTDEAWVALAALAPTPAAALTAGQSTPPLYMLTVWSIAHIFGSSEAALRSLSLLFGVGLLALFWQLARRLTSLPAALVSLAVVAFSPVMVYYSKELKQYSGDAFWGLLLLVLVERLRKTPQQPWVWAALALAGTVGLGFSHTLLFVLPVAALVLALSLPAALRPRLALLAACWALAFTVCYFAFIRGEMDPKLVAYWSQDFPDFSGFRPFFFWLGPALYRYFYYFLGEWGVYWAPPLAAAGIMAVYRQGRGRVLLYFFGPLLLAFAAACLHRYPFMAHYGGNRLMLFSAPLLYLLVAAGGCAAFARLWQARQGWLALAVTGLIVLSLHPGEIFLENLHPMNNREQLKPLVAELARRLQPQDLVYVYYFAVPPFKYYYQGPQVRLCLGKSCIEKGLQTTVGGAPAPHRIWLIASHIVDLPQMRRFAAGLLGPPWRERLCLTRQNAALISFERPQEVLTAQTPAPARLPGSAAATAPSGTAYK
jgi:4-amino-4-deoxy-L-arabinose transferase-like glycosyltransferase